jgi:phosphoribosyl 1,2-cyclic phosphodiesterase
MEVTFWGVRGSVAAPGEAYNRYGGNTTCVSVRTAGGGLIILDAGTGIIELGRRCMEGAMGTGKGEAHLLLSHAHWDHIQGFPFFVPAYVPGNRLTIMGPGDSTAVLEEILEGQMAPNVSPVHSLNNLGAEITIKRFSPGMTMAKGGLEVSCDLLPHGRSETLVYRLCEGGRTLVFATDLLCEERPSRERLLALCRGAHCLVHDCTFTPEDQEQRRQRGYSSIADAASVAAEARVGTLVMTHYDQDYTDEQVDRLAARCRELLDQEPGGADVKLVAAKEGLTLTV